LAVEHTTTYIDPWVIWIDLLGCVVVLASFVVLL